MSDQWYYDVNGQASAPVTKAMLGQMLSSGQINRQTQVIREGIQWTPLGDVPELRDIFPASSPVKPVYPQPTQNYSVSRKSKESPFVEFLMKLGFADADCPGNVFEIPGSLGLSVLVSGLITFWAYALIPKLALLVFIVILVLAFTAFYCTNKVLIIILSSIAGISLIILIIGIASTSEPKTASAAVIAWGAIASALV